MTFRKISKRKPKLCPLREHDNLVFTQISGVQGRNIFNTDLFIEQKVGEPIFSLLKLLLCQ